MHKHECLCIDLRTAANTITSLYDDAIREAGVSATQFNQIQLIRSLNGPTLKQLAQASHLDRSALGRNVRVLENLGLLTMVVGADARTKTLHLTRKGRETFRRAARLCSAAQTKLSDRLGADGRHQLDRLLAALTDPL